MFGSKKETPAPEQPVPVVTTEAFPGRSIQYLDSVSFSNSAVGTGANDALLRGIGLVGAQKGADAVVGVRFAASSGMKGTTQLFAFGTAVKFID